MLLYLKTLLPGIAGSIGFWILDNHLLKLEEPYRTAGMIVAFFVFTGASLLLMRKGDADRHRILSDRNIKGDSEDRLGKINIKGGGKIDMLSGNRIKGKSKTDIDRIDIG
jgi:hypothetical protein